MNVHTVGLSYRQTPLVLRELVAMSADAVREGFRQLKQACQVREVVILSTCNRTEVYFLSDAPEKVSGWLGGLAQGRVEGQVYRLQSADAVRHLFRVASGLDSQLVGEPEITGQVKRFAELARDAQASGLVINRLMESALTVAKEVRTHTEVGRHSLSYPGLAMRAAAGIFHDLRETSVLFVGGGDMALSGGAIFADAGVRRLVVAGRSAEKTSEVARRIGAEPMPIAGVPEALAEFDVVVSATASSVPIIGKGAVERALRKRRHRPMLFADLAVPCDLEPEIRELSDVFVYDLDQFAETAKAGLDYRQRAAVQAEPIIRHHTEEFLRWLRGRRAVPRIRTYRESVGVMRVEETEAGLARLARGEAPETVLQDAMRRFSGRVMHEPTRWLRWQEDDDAGSAE